MSSRIRHLQALLDQALTASQATHFLAHVVARMSPEAWNRLEERLDPDLFATVRGVRDAWSTKVPSAPPSPAPSREKILQEWDTLRSRWSEIVERMGDHEGCYFHGEHWECPALDPGEVASDLEDVARAMHPLVERVHAEFAEDARPFEFGELEDAITQLPEWIYTSEYLPLDLGPWMTRVALSWEWLECHGDAARFLPTVTGENSSLEFVRLDRTGMRQWVEGLSESDGSAVLALLRSSDDVSLDGGWNEVFLALVARHDPVGWLESSRETISQDWAQGFSGLARFVATHDATHAIDVAQRMFQALSREAPAAIEERLVRRFMRWGCAKDEVRRLLVLWLEAADAMPSLGRRSAALRLQIALLDHHDDWDRVSAAFASERDRSGEDHPQALEADWKALVLEEHAALGGGGDVAWAQSLLDGPLPTSLQLDMSVGTFLSMLRGAGAGEHLAALMTLTSDVMSASGACPSHPKLLDLSRAKALQAHQASRRVRLERVGCLSTWNLLRAWWAAAMPRLVPDPSSSYKSRYHAHVAWVAAFHELDAAGAARLLDVWRRQHARRTSLWRELQEAGLDSNKPRR